MLLFVLYFSILSIDGFSFFFQLSGFFFSVPNISNYNSQPKFLTGLTDMLFKSLIAKAFITCCLSTLSLADDLHAIEIVGNKFFFSNNGSQFLMRGVAYQQNSENSTADFVDPLADPESCKRDIPYLQELETNVIRVYALDVDQDHTECMQLLQDAGIYVIADLSVPDVSINRDDPEWNLELYNRYTGVVDLFHNYTNILGFFAGNEVTNAVNNTAASAFVKAAIRDTKSYIKAQGYRLIPVGYSSNDDTAIRVPLAEYFACGDEDDRADFFGMNMYEWCGKSTFKSSGYENITDEYSNLGIPIFFSEYGCNEVSPRIFQEVGTIYSDKMTDVWSGGIVYMYFQEANDYGLVSIDSSGDVKTLEDFNNLKSQLESISPSLAQSSDVGSTTVTSCPTEGSDWEAATNLPPIPDDTVCNCMKKSLDCIVDSDVDEDDYEDLFNYVCGEISCDGINANGTSGDYGAYSICNSKDRLSFVLNLYYLKHSACDFSGSATLQDAHTASTCSAYLKSAGTSGLGTVEGSVVATSHVITGTDTASAKDSSSSSDSSDSSSSDSSDDSKGNAANAVKFPIFLVSAALIFGVSVAFA